MEFAWSHKAKHEQGVSCRHHCEDMCSCVSLSLGKWWTLLDWLPTSNRMSKYLLFIKAIQAGEHWWSTGITYGHVRAEENPSFLLSILSPFLPFFFPPSLFSFFPPSLSLCLSLSPFIPPLFSLKTKLRILSLSVCNFLDLGSWERFLIQWSWLTLNMMWVMPKFPWATFTFARITRRGWALYNRCGANISPSTQNVVLSQV